MSTPIATVEDGTPAPVHKAREERLYTAKPWTLVWWRFRKHVLAVVSLNFLILTVLAAVFADFLSPYSPEEIEKLQTYIPPTAIHFLDQGSFKGPFVYRLKRSRDPETARVIYVDDESTTIPVRFFVEGSGHAILGLIPTNLHLFGLDDSRQRLNLLGTDSLGRDLFSRLLYGARVTLSAGLVGVSFSFVIGLAIGSVSGYYGGRIDAVIQRLMEFIRSVPTIPLWMGFAAALPIEWDPLFVYVLITLILALIGWTNLARVVRGRFFSLKTEDYVLAARLA